MKNAKSAEGFKNENLDKGDFKLILQNEFSNKMISHQVESMNIFYNTGIKQIVKDTFSIVTELTNKRTTTPEDFTINKYVVSVVIDDVMLQKPIYINPVSSLSQILTPNIARLRELTYQSNVYINATINAVAYKKSGEPITKTEKITNFKICAIPTMVKSCLCNVNNFTKDMLINHEEDPTDKGGYFIIKGLEWVIDNQENIIYNVIRTYRNIGYKNELARGEIISKPGDAFENSSEIIIKMYNNDQMICKLNNTNMNVDGKILELPFYTIFRLFGVTKDSDIIEYILLDINSPVGIILQGKLEAALNCKYQQFPNAKSQYTQLENILYLSQSLDTFKKLYNNYGELIGTKVEDQINTKKYIVGRILDLLDKYFLPHIGDNKNSRLAKMRYFGHMIMLVLLTESKVTPSTKRDDYENKRVHPPGVTYSKSFKSQYSHAIVNETKKSIRNALLANSFSNINWVNVVHQAMNSSDFEKALSQVITRSDNVIVIKQHTFRNHITAQYLQRKGTLHVISTMRQVTSSNNSAANKSSERANQMRRVDGSFAGYICIVQSADTGELVGMKKQMAISASVTTAGVSVILKTMIMKEPDFLLLENVPSKMILDLRLSKVFVNGDWIGLVPDGKSFVNKYRDYRRFGKIDMYTTIQWNFILDEIYLWVDVGRIIRPLLIVYNNKYDPYDVDKKDKSSEKFEQYISITPEHIKKLYNGSISNEDLRQARVIEYITPEEQSRMLIAKSLDELLENKNNEERRFTHCEIEQSVLGLIALTSPYSNSNQMTRLCYHTNQAKLACSWFALNWKNRHDKETFIQYYVESPLVRTMTNKYFNPCGTNVIVAIMFYGGFNQDDGIIFNEDSLKRGLFTGSSFAVERVELETKEEICTPNNSNTLDFMANADYSKLVNGLIPVNSIIKEGDIIIGKHIPVDNDSQYKYADRSIMYKRTEDAIVENVIPETRNQSDVNICKVATRNIRVVTNGDKFTSRHGQKGVCSAVLSQANMPFTESGLVPDLILNPHYLPTRMTVGQILESIMGKLCAHQGHTTDGTVFTEVDIDKIGDDLASHGFDRHGEEEMYNPDTGKKLESKIFIGPVYYHRLQKFVANAIYAVNSGPTCAVTKQPVSGRVAKGGMRLGEMERDVMVGNGAVMALGEKFGEHSDGSVFYICARCGSKDLVVANEYNDSVSTKCKNCLDLGDIVKVNSTTSTNVFMHEISSMGIGVNFKINPPQFETFK